MSVRLTGLVQPIRDDNGFLNSSARYRALHEAGHALVAEAVGRRVAFISIKKEGRGPRVELEVKDGDAVACPINFGGFLAVEYGLGAMCEPALLDENMSAGCEADCRNAGQCANSYWSRLPASKIFSSTDVETISTKFLSLSQSYAWALVVGHWDKVLNLMAQLEMVEEMNGDDCRKALGLFWADHG